VLFNRGRRSLALKRLDVRRHYDGLNVLEILITDAIGLRQELLNRPIIGGSRISVTNPDGKKFKEFFSR
jgi:hypothetical protein